MLIIAIATSPEGRVTHHLVRAEGGSAAYRRLRPLLPVGSQINTMSLEHWRETRGDLPRDLRPLDKLSREERAAILAGAGRLIPAGRRADRHVPPGTAAPAPSRTGPRAGK